MESSVLELFLTDSHVTGSGKFLCCWAHSARFLLQFCHMKFLQILKCTPLFKRSLM